MRVHKSLRPIVDEALREGWEVTHTKNGHLRFAHPCGALVFGASTPSDHRTVKNLRGHLRQEMRKNS